VDRKKRIKTLHSHIHLVGIGCAVSLWLYEMNGDIHKSKTAFILFIGKKTNYSMMDSRYRIFVK
jgi:hypothetical protein